jgi:Bacterial archaeo-eukaryotic release factor family 2
MEQHGTALAPLTDLDDLRPVVAGLGPFLSVHLPLEPATEELATEIALRWRAGRSRAVETGAPEPVLAVVDGLLEGAQRLGAGLSVIAAAGGDVHVSHTPVPPPFEVVRWEPVPSLAPLVAVRQQLQPHVVALVDRIGADLAVRRGFGPRDGVAGGADETDETIDGDDYPIRKTSGGGWSQRRYQQQAEETWHHNMSDVAHELATLTERSDARVVAIGGDERAVGLVLDQLPAAVRHLVRHIAATRAADGSTDQLDDEVARVVGGWTDAQLARTLDLYDQELGQNDRAAAGARDTLAALREARVAVLLVVLDANDERRAWVGASPDQVGVAPEELAAGQPAEVQAASRSAPLVDVAVAAAVATGADVRVVPTSAGLTEGLGALLRW